MRIPPVIVCLAAALAAATAATAAPGASRGTVTVRASDYGRIVFDGRGFVLYAFTRDRGGRSSCYGACAKAWPPYLASSVSGGKLVGTTRRSDGKLQVTYQGQPLYYYVGDRKPGQILCQNVAEFGGTWLVVHPGGELVR
jgi:predicted lipoprotein with Yx(FWY)xxD motif